MCYSPDPYYALPPGHVCQINPRVRAKLECGDETFSLKDWSRYMTVPSSGKSLNFDATVSYKLSLGCENALEQILSQVWHLYTVWTAEYSRPIRPFEAQ